MKYYTWKTIKTKLAYSSPIFDLLTATKEEETGKVKNFVQVDAPNWATMVPYFVNKEGVPCFLMAKQYRHGEEKVTLEYVAGTVERGEEPLSAAKREFREETGFIDGDFTLIGQVSPNSAFMTNTLSVYLVENFSVQGERELDEDESIELVEVPISKVIKNMGKNEYSNGIMSIATLYYLQYTNSIKL